MVNRQQQSEKFEAIYTRLNEQQRKAVDTIEGPVMVNAGPGTGKTQILATRIGKILLETDTDPRNILCLTFTDNGVVEMRNRLLQFIGAPAYRVNIHTFHSFCNEVIRDNLSYFGKLNLEPISDLEETQLYIDLIDSIEKNSPLKRFRGDVYYEKDRLKPLFGLMKKEAWDIDYLNERIDAYLETLPTKEGFFYKRKYKEFNAGDPNPVKIAAETEKQELLRAAVNLYPRYNRMMRDISRYNFDDMILWVLDAFENNKNMLLDYQERYLYFLVDEFQDTSGSQNKLLQYLVEYWDVPNVFAVGDADQSVFSFQDANVENIVKFENRYAGILEEIDLVNNYRSTQIILDTAHQLIVNNTARITKNDQPLITSNPERQQNINPAIIEYPNTAHETIDIVQQVEELLQQGIPGKEIAIIYRNHAQVEEIITLLEAKKISVNIRRKIDLLQLPFINNIISLLTWIAKENEVPYSGDELLFRILHFEFFSVPPIQAAKMSVAVNDKRFSDKEEKYSLRRAISEQTPHAKADLFNQPDNSLKQVSDTLEGLIKESNNVTLQNLISQVLDKTNVLGYVMRSPEKPWLMEVLNSFFNFIKDGCKRNPGMNLNNLLNDLETMRRGRIMIPLYKASADENGINLVTAHSSKGSEFLHVFMIGCTQNIWDDNSGNNRTYKYPDNLQSSLNTASDMEESRRLFYVSLTRAKTHLHISYPVKDKKDKEQTRSTFVTEILEGMHWQPQQKKVNDDQLTSYLALQFIQTARPEIELVEDNYLTQLLKRYSLSVTHLNNYLECPLKFYYQNLIKVPSAKSGSMVFGSTVHFALQRLFEKMKKNNDVFPSKGEMMDDFTWYLNRNREAFTKEEFILKMQYGEKILPAYYDFHINGWSKVVVVEKNMRNIEVQGIPINGKLDKLEFNGKSVNVVDYKTGKYENAKKQMTGPNDNKPDGGNYWRQAVFYKILIDNDRSNDWEVASSEFDFVEPVGEEYLKEKISINREDVTTVTQQIKQVWGHIQNKDFNTGCGKPDCEWCNFAKTNHLAVALHAPDEDEDQPI